jgi:hypothetical protein
MSNLKSLFIFDKQTNKQPNRGRGVKDEPDQGILACLESRG